jgi:hypothetical protein
MYTSIILDFTPTGANAFSSRQLPLAAVLRECDLFSL